MNYDAKYVLLISASIENIGQFLYCLNIPLTHSHITSSSACIGAHYASQGHSRSPFWYQSKGCM